MVCSILRIDEYVCIYFDDDSWRRTEEYEIRLKQGILVNKNTKEETPIPSMSLIAESIEINGVIIDFNGELREEIEL